MKLPKPITLQTAAEYLGCSWKGEADHQITGINEIHKVISGDLTFVDIEKYYAKALNSAATTILINKEVQPPSGKGLLISDDPFRDYNRLTDWCQPRNPLDLTGEPVLEKEPKSGAMWYSERG